MAINYPTKKQTNEEIKKTHYFKSQGMTLENELNVSNEYYIKHNKANIHKKPTPIQVVRVDYPARNKAKIVEAYYKLPSTTDYNGIYRMKYIDYEAKETQNSAFYFKFIYEHQIDHLLKIDELGGIAFVIIYFNVDFACLMFAGWFSATAHCHICCNVVFCSRVFKGIFDYHQQ